MSDDYGGRWEFWRGCGGPSHRAAKVFYRQSLKRLCGFPDDFILTGTFGQQWERLGRARAADHDDAHCTFRTGGRFYVGQGD